MAKNDRSDTDPLDIKTALVEAIKSLPPDELRAILMQSGVTPTTIGMTAESMQMLLGSLSATNAETMKMALRSQRKENPNYPERSVFHPSGKFDDAGNALPAKAGFKRPTYFQHVLLGGEAETEIEIQLCNSFTEDKSSRDGRWTAEIKHKGTKKESLHILIPSLSADDRMENSLPFPFILRELLDGADAVNPETMAARIAELEARVKRLAAGVAA